MVQNARALVVDGNPVARRAAVARPAQRGLRSLGRARASTVPFNRVNGGYRMYTAAELNGNAPEAPAPASPPQPTAAAPVTELRAAAPPPPARAPVPPMQQPTASTSGGFLGDAQELMNGRAAMAGFVAAVAVEVSTGNGVFSQLFETVTFKNTGVSTLGINGLTLGAYVFTVLMITMGSLAPFITDGPSAKPRSFGPFTPSAEMMNGRVAMLGFVSLFVAEAVKGSAIF